MILRGGSDGEAVPAHMPFPPFMMAYPMAYSMGADASSPHYVPPSPLMGSPVGTPTGKDAPLFFLL
jgi:hypothetical protein